MGGQGDGERELSGEYEKDGTWEAGYRASVRLLARKSGRMEERCRCFLGAGLSFPAMYPGGAREERRVRLASVSEGVCEECRGLCVEGLGGVEGKRAQWLFAS